MCLGKEGDWVPLGIVRSGSFKLGSSEQIIGAVTGWVIELETGYPSQAVREAATEVASRTSGADSWTDGYTAGAVTSEPESSGGTLSGSGLSRGSIFTNRSITGD